jgi:hypothetical protein
LDSKDDAMNDEPERQLLDKHNDTDLKLEVQPTRKRIANIFQITYDAYVMIL